MKLKVSVKPYTLKFKRPAGTSRGVYIDHKVWYVLVSSVDNPEIWGIGECAPLFDLSCDYTPDYEKKLIAFCKKLEFEGSIDIDSLQEYPSILFGFETALRQIEMQSFNLYNTNFTTGEEGIPINGLVWMGSFDYMFKQIETKLNDGFQCIKLKIGAIDFQEELTLLKHIRKHFSAKDVTLRVDANGGFTPDEALEKLYRLAELDIHSIEQPIRAGLWDEMSELTSKTPLPIALDEELIGVNKSDQKKLLLQSIKPQYIILKPTLHGGLSGATEWINLAEQQKIGWWITSALESNIGLNAIAQWTSTFYIDTPQGLGTGGLYTNNIEMPLYIKKDHLYYNPKGIFFDKNDLF